MKSDTERLDSWKAIADYLRRDRTTVMRWERTSGLPVRRVAGRSVFAYKSEIDRWLATQPEGAAAATEAPPPPLAAGPPPAAAPVPLVRRAEWFAVALAAAGVLGVALFQVLVGGSSSPVASASLVGDRIVAADAEGRTLWNYAVPPAEHGVQAPRITVADIDDDGRKEVIAALLVSTSPGQGHGELVVLDDDGDARWTRRLVEHYRFGDADYGPGWFPNDLTVYRAGGQTRLAVAEHHHTWWPSVVSTYDRDGNILGRFVNAGWITSLIATGDGRHLLAAGVNNALGGAALAVLDGAVPTGTSPPDGGSLPRCSNCPGGQPLRYFIAPWSDLARPSDSINVVVQVTANGSILWRAPQRSIDRGKVAEFIITLSPALDVVERSVGDYFVELHNELERTGALEPTASSGDWRRPAVREWRPGRGWLR